ncbi:MAG: hypothetical protein JNL67_15315 [Planctomycetaceae bacterium]|nr:hypothetical protein [Planctomycetaceae bacterium]
MATTRSVTFLLFCTPVFCWSLFLTTPHAYSQLPDSPLRPALQNPALGATSSAPALGPLPTSGVGPSNSLPGTLPQVLTGNGSSSSSVLSPVGGSPTHSNAILQPLRTDAAPSNDPIERGVVDFQNPASSNVSHGSTSSSNSYGDVQPINYETAVGEGELSPMEQRYSAWWREVLATANLTGEAVELKSILQRTSVGDRVATIREYWRLSEAIIAVQIHREALETWQAATVQQSQQTLAQNVTEILQLQIEQANATVSAEQEHLGLWLQKHGLPQVARPVDAPFLGPYDTKLSQLQLPGQDGSDLALAAQTVDTQKQELLRDERALDWAEQEWERARASGDLQRMATMIQLRQAAYLLWLNRVTRYNDAIAQYAFRFAGPGVSLPQQLAMLLRQPIVDGRLVDTRTDPWFRSSPVAGADFREIAPVSYNQPAYGYDPASGMTGNWQPARGR